MHVSINRWTAAALGAAATGVISVGWYLGSRVPDPPSHPFEIALSHTPPAWPPAAADLDAELAATTRAIQAIQRTAIDAGTDAGELDAGPPIPLGAVPVEGMQVRVSEQGGVHYLEAVLGAAGFEDPLPMIVVLHGRGGSAQIPGGPFLELPYPVRVIAPQAPDRLGTGYAWLPVYVGQGLVDRLSATLFQTASRIAALVRALAAERPTKGLPIVSGFSQGGLLTLTLALHHDDVVGAAFPLACWLPPPLEPTYRRPDLRFPPIRSMHGTADRIIPIGPTRQLFGRLRELGFDAEMREIDGVGHEISEEENAIFHAWLAAAVCRAMGDATCEREAELSLLPDAGVPLDSGIEDAGVPDAGSDAGRRRRAPRAP